MRYILEWIFASFTFKFNMLKSRLICRRMRLFIEKRIDQINPDRILFYSFKPGFDYPKRENKIIMLANKCHLFFWTFFPDYNQWMFNYIIKNSKEIYIVMDTLNKHWTSFTCNVFKSVPIKYLKILNGDITGTLLNMLVVHAERVCMKNMVYL